MSEKDPFALGFEIINAPDTPGQMVAIVVPDYVPVPRLKRLDFKWFWDLKNPLFESAKNTIEMRARIKWLSEGSLRYHLFHTAVPHGGCPRREGPVRKVPPSQRPLPSAGRLKDWACGS